MARGAYDYLYIKMDLAKNYMKMNPEGDTAGMNQIVKETIPVLWDHYYCDEVEATGRGDVPGHSSSTCHSASHPSL